MVKTTFSLSHIATLSHRSRVNTQCEHRTESITASPTKFHSTWTTRRWSSANMRSRRKKTSSKRERSAWVCPTLRWMWNISSTTTASMLRTFSDRLGLSAMCRRSPMRSHRQLVQSATESWEISALEPSTVAFSIQHSAAPSCSPATDQCSLESKPGEGWNEHDVT